MKVNTLILFLILLSSFSKKESVHYRFEFKKISLTAVDRQRGGVTSKNGVHINHYIECGSDGHCLIAKRDSFGGSLKYFSNELPLYFDSLFQKIDLTKLDSLYEPPMEKPPHMLYCGLPYFLTYENKQGILKYALIIPSNIDPLLIKLVKSMDEVVRISKQPTKEKNLNSIRKYIQIKLIQLYSAN